MTDPYVFVRSALHEYARAVAAAWQHPLYTPIDPSSPSSRESNLKKLVTRASGDAPATLPSTGQLVRGTAGVVVEKVDHPANPSPTVNSAFIRARAKWRAYPLLPDDAEATRQAVTDAEHRAVDALAEIPALLERTYDISGFKNDDAQGIREMILNESADPSPTSLYGVRRRMGLSWTLSRFLVEGLEQAGLDPEALDAFCDWDTVIEHTVGRLRQLETRETWTYEVVALLNAPLIDQADPFELVQTDVGGQQVTITAETVSDDLLNTLRYRNYNFTGVGLGVATAPVNTALRYLVTVPVEAPIDAYINVLSAAADVFTRVVDVIRLVRSDDLGIVGVESLPADREAPTIRYHYDVDHNPAYASIVPRRSYFFVESTTPLSNAHLDVVRKVLPAYLDGSHSVEGLDVAVRRYRDSRERYRPGDLESLLDLTVALEALLLTGSERTELSYRLGIRASRLLGGTLAERLDLFVFLHDLYALRSKLAHGDTIRFKDTVKARAAVVRASRVVRTLCLEFLLGNGPSGLRGKDLTDWWRAVELGPDDSDPG